MKNLRHLLTAFLLVCCTVAMAEIVTIGGITYDVIVKAKQASVFAKETGEYSGSVVIPETIVYNDVTYSVTTIGESTFAYCDGLTSVTIPNSVTTIGKEAFSNCGLTSITIPNSVTTIGNRAFYDCGIKEVHISDLAAWCNISFEGFTANPLFYAQNLYLNGELVTDLVIPNSVTTIGNRAFYNYYGLTSVTIPNSVTTIGDEAFYKCYRLTSITIPNSVTTIGNDAFAYCSGLTSITIPNSVTTIGYRAFMECDGLTSVTIPNSVTSIGSSAFYDCEGLTSITIPNSVTSIGFEAFAYTAWYKNQPDGVVYAGKVLYEYKGTMPKNTSIIIKEGTVGISDLAFYNCSNLTSITIPNSVTNIGDEAFYSCSGLTSITIPNSVITIGNRAFYNCDGLTSITIPNSVTTIGNDAFANTAWYKNQPDGVVYAGKVLYEYKGTMPKKTSIIIKEGTVGISDLAFYNCSNLTSITIPNSVITIGNRAFYNCDGLTSITIPNSVTTIGERAFCDCFGLTSITIPNSVTSIGSYAFSDCSGLTSVTIGSGVEYIYSYAFAICENLVDIYCLATIVPLTYSDAFNESYPEYMTLHVPAEAINSYKIKAPWSSFGNIVAINGGSTPTPTPKCANPVISYRNGELFFDCQTYGAEFVTKITDSDIDTFYSKSVTLSAIYNISVYATANGYDNSNTVNATLCWIENGESDNSNNIINIPAVAVLVTSANGVVTVSCSLEGETVAVYTTDGTLVGSAAITNGSATIQSGLSKGSVAIVKIGNKSVKVVVD